MTSHNLRSSVNSGVNSSVNLSHNSPIIPVETNRFAVLGLDSSLSSSSAQATANEAAIRQLEIEDAHAREQIALGIAQNEPKTVAERMAEAKLARQNAKQEQIILEGIEILYDQGDNFDFSSAEIVALNLSAESLQILMGRYIAKPTRDIRLSKGGNSISLTSDVIRLKGNITSHSAEDFQTMSDIKGRLWTPEISELINGDAEFTIQGWLDANNTDVNYNIPMGWESWQTSWSHATLAKFVTMVWGKNRAPLNTLVDEINNFDLGVNVNIMDTASEEATLVRLNILLQKFPNEAKDPHKQKVLCQILDKKMPTGHEIRTDMRNLPIPTDTKKWISNYRRCRAAARVTIKRSAKYLSLQNANINKTGGKRLNSEIGGWGTKTDFTNNDLEANNRKFLKKQKRHRAKAEGQEVDWSEIRCKGCGKTNHLLKACFQSNGETEHRDRNKEDKPFHLSTKGKQWIADQAHGPFCNPFWHLDGTERVSPKPIATAQGSKFTTLLTSVIDRININKPIHSDYLPVYITLPQDQTMAEEEAEEVEEAEAEEVEEVHSAGVKMDEAEDEAVPVKLVQALLDSGCLVGDCISQDVVNSLNARHLVVNIHTTICSGFDNTCSDSHPSVVKN